MRKFLVPAIAALSLLVLPAAGQAQAQGAGAQPSAIQQELVQLKQEIDALKRQVAAIQKQAMQDHPELEQQKQELADLIRQTASDQGYDAGASKDRLMALQQRYKSGNLSPEEEQQVAAEFRDERDAMREAQQRVLQDAQVQQARNAFAEDMSAAMAETDPEAEALMEELKALTMEFRDKLEAVLERRQAAN